MFLYYLKDALKKLFCFFFINQTKSSLFLFLLLKTDTSSLIVRHFERNAKFKNKKRSWTRQLCIVLKFLVPDETAQRNLQFHQANIEEKRCQNSHFLINTHNFFFENSLLCEILHISSSFLNVKANAKNMFIVKTKKKNLTSP